MALAGMLEIADREFQAIQCADKEIIDTAREKVASGDLIGVEITPLSLKQFLDKKLGPDARISEWAYDWETRLVKTLGFTDLKQIETAIAKYDDNQLSIAAYGNRQGQRTRFELALLAALGERFIDRHPWRTTEWFAPRYREFLKRFLDNGIGTSTYDPADYARISPTGRSHLAAITSGEAGLPWSQVTSHEPAKFG
jgi:putative GTP pyrophosphokinase